MEISNPPYRPKLYALYPTQDEKRVINFVQTAQSNDHTRIDLTGIIVDSAHKMIAAADSFRLHLAKMPKCIANEPELQDQIIKFINKPRMSDQIWFAEIVDNAKIAPNYWNVMERIPKPRYSVSMAQALFHTSTKALAVATGDEGIVMNIGQAHKPFTFFPAVNSENGLQVVLMPRHNDDWLRETEIGAVEIALENAQKALESTTKRLKRADLNERISVATSTAKKLSDSTLIGEGVQAFEQFRALEDAVIRLENKIKDSQSQADGK